MAVSFSWLIPNEVAAMSRPGSDVKSFEFLADKGIEAVVSLTESPLPKAFIEEFGFEYHHVPVRDFTAPTLKQVDQLVRFITKTRERGKVVAVHCGAGLGRTGTVLSCYLVSQGYSAQDAIAKVRSVRPGSVETQGQEDLVVLYEKRLRRKKKKR